MMTMLLKGSRRGGSNQMAKHLCNGEQNEIVTVHEVSGFMSESVTGALNEIYAVSKGTKARKFMHSLSLNPPPDKSVSVADFEAAIEKVEKKLKLDNQPRVVVFHEKNGRRHAHCVWSRIDADEMKAIPLPYDREKLKYLSKELFLEHKWELPQGYIERGKSNPLNFTRAEMEQALRSGRKASDIKRELQECWAVSDDKKSFEHALQDCEYWLVKGDRRNIAMAVDIKSEAYPLHRQIGVKAKDINERLGDINKLPTIETIKNQIALNIRPVFEQYIKDARQNFDKQIHPLLHEKQLLVDTHKKARQDQKDAHQQRWNKEETNRSKQVRRGFKGIFDVVTGAYFKNRKKNERETWHCYLRDQKERDELIEKQMIERRNVQASLDLIKSQFEKERQEIMLDVAHVKNLSKEEHDRLMEYSKEHGKDFDDLDHELDL